jgi:hypothetical protein
MSRTAGLGSGDYVAINNTAIVALVLGLASVLSWWFPVMMLAALAAAVCGVLALVQIRSSNGTQTGHLFAGLGIALGLALGGAALWRIAAGWQEHRRDEQAIGQLVKELSDRIVQRNYADAYQNLFTDQFRQDFSLETFEGTWERFGPVSGPCRRSAGAGGRSSSASARRARSAPTRRVRSSSRSSRSAPASR